VRLHFAESLVLVTVGAGGGLLIARTILIALQQLRPDIPRIGQSALTPTVLLFTAAIAMGCALVVSVAPAMLTHAGRLRDRLNEGGRGGSDGAGAERARRLLVVSQMALACVLLAAGGLLIRSLQNVLQVDPGFRASGVVMFDTYLPTSRYPEGTAYTRFSRELVRELARTPGVSDAGGLLYFPFRPKLWPTALWVEGQAVPEGQEPVVYFNLIAGDYFAAMGVDLIEGRLPNPEEMWDRRGTVVINRSLSRELFRDERAIGRRVRTDKDGPWFEVIGVVDDVRQKGLQDAPRPEVYLPFSSMPMPFLTWVVRSDRPPDEIAGRVRRVVAQIDAGLAVANLMPLTQHVNAHTANRRFGLLLLGGFAALALGLGAVGIYGVLSYTVAQRRRELAIRLAIGASPQSVQAMVLRSGLRVGAIGTLVGLVGAVVAGRLMQTLLFGVGTFDVVTFVLVGAVVMTAAVAASWLPAWRASRLDGLEALQSDV
jgi:putative ABC transport system permease protein